MLKKLVFLCGLLATSSVAYVCNDALQCTEITEEAVVGGACGKPCVKEVCLTIAGNPGCPSTLSHVCDQADANGCPYASSWDQKTTAVAPPCPEFGTQKCEGGDGPPVGTRLCQFAAPGETVFWIVKKANVKTDALVTIDGDTKCYLYAEWTKAGFGNPSPFTADTVDSCSGNSDSERVIEYTVLDKEGSCCPDTFCGCGQEVVMDFSAFSHGDWVGDLGNGVTLKARPKTGGYGNIPRIYDTSRGLDWSDPLVVDPELEDPDLDCTDDGQALIIQEGPDVPDRLPDDNANGGFIDIFFAKPTDVGTVRILDTESDSTVKTWNVDGTTLKETVPSAGDCGISTYAVERRDVVRMTVKFPESGAVSAFSFCDYGL